MPTDFFRPSRLNRMLAIWCTVALLTLSPAMASAAGPGGDSDDDDGPAKPMTELIVTARRLDAARANIDPDTGASSYTLSNETVESRPGGETTNINQVLLQAPGVLQDGSGRLHVRQSHGDLQYRINNAILPEGISDLGESLSARLAQNIQLITGALPAQYGFQAGGVVNITTKNGAYLNGGQAELYGGSHGEFEPAFEYGASLGSNNIFVSGSYRRSDVGLASPDGSTHPLHDRTNQGEGFAFLDHILDPQTRVSAILGISDDRFQIPNQRGLNAASTIDPEAAFTGPLTVNGVQNYPSEALNGTRREATRYGIVSLMHATDHMTIQAAAFLRQSILSEQADGIGDLLFKGLGIAAHETNDSGGLQLETVYELAAAHSMRGGIVASWEGIRTDARTQALRIDGQGRQISDVPMDFTDHARLYTRKLSAFLQDEWRPTNDITLNLGMRVDDVRAAQSGRRLSPRAGAVWTIGGAMLHIGYARYFLPPPHDAAGETPVDLAGTSAAPPTLTGNVPGFETDDYYDAGLQWTLENLTMGIDGYWRDAHNLIAEGPFGPAHLDRVFSYDKARIRGVELTATYSKGAISAWMNLALAQARGRGISGNPYYFTSARLTVLAAHFSPLGLDQLYTASAGLSYHHGPLRLSGDILYGSGLPQARIGGMPGGSDLPEYAQCNLAAVYRIASFAGRPLDMRMDITNVFDARYLLRDAGGPASGLPQWGPRRGVFVGIEQAF